MSRLFNRKWKAGFTLVELIVVIAILAILAGIAIPVYSGYIKKANQASDEQLLSAVNTAFAAACQENYINRLKLTGAKLEMTDSCVTGVKSLSGLDGAVLLRSESHSGLVQLGAHPAQIAVDEAKITAAVNDSFKKYFGSNNGTPFRVYNKFTYDPSTGTFSGEAKASVLVAGYEWKNTEGVKALYEASGYAKEDIAELTGLVDNLTSVLSLAGNIPDKLAEMPAFRQVMKDLGIEGSTDKQDIANAAVFFVASKLNGIDAGDIYKNMAVGKLDTFLKGKNIDPSTNEGLFVQTALQYGVIKAYINSDFASDEEIAYFKNNTPTDVTSAAAFIDHFTSSTSYVDYITDADEDGQSQADVSAFMGILGVLNDNTDAFASVSGADLFSDPEVLAAIQRILG